MDYYTFRRGVYYTLGLGVYYLGFSIIFDFLAFFFYLTGYPSDSLFLKAEAAYYLLAIYYFFAFDYFFYDGILSF
jgi:hypothetical protein